MIYAAIALCIASQLILTVIVPRLAPVDAWLAVKGYERRARRANRATICLLPDDTPTWLRIRSTALHSEPIYVTAQRQQRQGARM